jgi:shikimate dehydrogenase
MLNQKNISTHTKILCIIGHPISHSMSPLMHNIALKDLNLDYMYIAFDVIPDNLKQALEGIKALNIRGINVTIPHKEKVIRYLDVLDPIAQKIGAVNAIKLKDSLFFGRNTDAEGAIQALRNSGINTSGLDVLLLGSGGAAKAVSYGLIQTINKLTILNRTEQKAKELANKLKKESRAEIEAKKLNKTILSNAIKEADLLINATPIGMYPSHHESIISRDMLHKDLAVFDLIYNPLETQLIKDAKTLGCKTLNGLDMLINQGALAFEWWTNKKPNTILMKKKVIETLSEK